MRVPNYTGPQKKQEIAKARARIEALEAEVEFCEGRIAEIIEEKDHSSYSYKRRCDFDKRTRKAKHSIRYLTRYIEALEGTVVKQVTFSNLLRTLEAEHG